MKLFKKLWPAKIEPHVPERELAISSPTEVTHAIHVVINRETNCFEGVPPGWRKQMDIIIGYVFFLPSCYGCNSFAASSSEISCLIYLQI